MDVRCWICHIAARASCGIRDRMRRATVTTPRNTRRSFRRLASWMLLLASLQATAATGLAWRVDTGGKPSYLVGSIHVGIPAMYPLPSTLKSAFAAADVLVVEADIIHADYDALAKQTYKLGLYHDGSNLRQHLTRAQWQALAAALQQVQIPHAVVLPQKPWLAYTTLVGAAFAAQGYSDQLGVDRHFMEQAQSRGKPIVELEGLQWQLKLLAGLDDSAQIDMLMDSVNHMERDRRALKATVDAWSRGDAEALRRLFDEGFSETPTRLRDALIGKRNATMAKSIRRMTKDGRSYFVVVGAGHFVGPDGIVARLRHSGFTVERLGADRR